MDRQFQADAPNQKWVADFNCLERRGRLYTAAVLDLHLWRIMGWSMPEGMTSQVVANALMMTA